MVNIRVHAHAALARRDALANVPLQVDQNMRISSLARQSSFVVCTHHCVHISLVRLVVVLAGVLVASRSGLWRCVLPVGWCYRHQSDLAEMSMGQHTFRWLAPHRFSLAVTILLCACHVDMCVVHVHAGRGRLRSKNIVSGAQVSWA